MRRARFLTLVGLLALFGSCRRETYEVRRPWADESLERVSLAGKTMRALRLERDPAIRNLAVGSVSAGRILFDAAVQGPPGTSLEISLVQPGSFVPWTRSAPGGTCRVATAHWQRCSLPITYASGTAELQTRLEGPPTAQGLVSSPRLVASSAPARPPVFVILIDTLRFDRIATYAPGLPLGERLDELARDGVVFERIYSSSSWTRTAVATLLSGLDARTHRVLGRTDALRVGLGGLPQALQSAGWHTLAWSTNANILPLWGFDAGFDAFVDLGALEWATKKTDASTVFAAVRDTMSSDGDERAFYYIHLMDPHPPYQPPAEDLAAVEADPGLLQTFPGADSDPHVVEEYHRYLAEVRDVDANIGSFLQDLRSRGIYQQALILVAADHGEEFLDHGGTLHGRTLYEEVVRIPVILKLPGNELAGMRIQQETGLADVAPTIAAILGVAGLEGVDGRNLWSAERRRFEVPGAPQNAFLDLDGRQLGAWVADREKLIVNYRDEDEQLFDLRSDPREQDNLVSKERPKVHEMRAALDQRMAMRAAGWHVRACGGLMDERVQLLIETAGQASGVDLESEDDLRRVEGAASRGWQATLRLTPRKGRREIFGKLVEEDSTDEDEIVIESPTAQGIALRRGDGADLTYSLGQNPGRITAPRLELAAADEKAIVSPSALVSCWDPSVPYQGVARQVIAARQSYLRVWYVQSPERRVEAEVDPVVKERLRALGYEW